MSTKSPCCPDGSCPECRYGPFQRNHYFTGKLLVERDFTDEQSYYVNKLRHHHQRLHGWGVVCGLKVVQHENDPCRDRYVIVEPGTAIDCCGREIVVLEREYVDVLSLPAVKALIDKPDQKRRFLQICIRYKECPNENIPVLYDDCGCDEDRCAPNRILESYEFDAILLDKLDVESTSAPTLAWTNTLFNITDVSRVAVFDTGSAARLYVLTQGAPNAVYELDLANNAVLVPQPLADTGLALSVNQSGDRLYVATGAPGADRNILVLDTADLSTVRTLAIANSKDSDIDLAVAADGRLVVLVKKQGSVIVWPTTIDAAAGAPVADATINVGNALVGLALSSNGSAAYTWDTVAKVVKTANLAGGVGPDLTKLPAGASPAALAMVSTAGGDQLIAVDSIAAAVHILNPASNTLAASGALANPAVDVAVTSEGAWAYVLEKDAAGASFVESIDLNRVRDNKPPVGGAPVLAGAASTEIVLAEQVQQLFVPYLGATAETTDGSLAIFTITSHECCERLWNSINGCPSCDEGNCVVLATLPGYMPHFKMLDGPPQPADAFEAVARIDNRLGRKLLPSTSALAEVIECLCESRGTGRDGKDGAPGTDGKPGDPGLGLFPDLPKILDIGWNHGKDDVTWDDFRNSSFYDANIDEVIERVKQTGRFPTLTVYFNKPMLGLDRQAFRVSFRYPQIQTTQQGTWMFTGLYNIFTLDIYGYPTFLGKFTTPHTAEPNAFAYAFIPDHFFFSNTFTQTLVRLGWVAFALSDKQLELPSLSVLLKGDFIYAGNQGDPFEEGRSLDADNIGGQVGINRVRTWPGTGGKNPSGDLAQGGNFESWLFLQPPKEWNPNAGLKELDRVPQFGFMRAMAPDINVASVDELAAVPGLSAGIAEKIVEARAEASFANWADLRKRLKLTDAAVKKIGDSLHIG